MQPTIPSLYHRDALARDATASIQAYYVKDWQGYDMAPHSHNQMEIMYVISGRCTIPLQGSELSLKKGEFVLLDAAVPHGLKVLADGPCRIMNIEFTAGGKATVLPLRAVAEKHPPLKRLLADARPAIVLNDTEDVYGALRRVINSMDDEGSGHELELELHTAELLLAIARLYDEGAGVKHTGDVYVRRAMQFMNRNYFREITMKDIAGHAGVAEAYLSRLFKKSAGEPVISYLTNLRIRKAKMLLGKTELPIVEISGYVGVPSREYFNQLFKKHTGLTPGEYRKLCAKEANNAYSGCL